MEANRFCLSDRAFDATNNVQQNQVFAGVNSSEATPVPIPNTEVKLACGDGIAGLTLWESSTMPALFYAQLGN